MRDAPAIGVEKRNGMQLDSASFDLQSQADVHRVQVHVAVGEHHAFGIGASATGVEKLGQGIFINGGDVREMRCGGGQKLIVILRGEPRSGGSAVKLTS